ncbi:MAG TPA: carboxylating nicotinate-nucleotide diphosphorylase [Candidatus Thermoplasmatota archaeon]|nr:carboxylating nicotinate-nucleotide diphosphorylase [Candidatus Thermoplasmatota archaeon]
MANGRTEQEPKAGRASGVDWIGLYLQEDLGAGDITTDPLFPASHQGSARLVARERALMAGGPHAVEVFGRLGAKATPLVRDGAWAEPGQAVLLVQGPTRAILAGERLALNLVARMSGIASQTRLLMEELARACSAAAVAGTRKTTPGFRAFEKEAIAVGGGDPHRLGLFDAVLLKDNHLAATGSVAAAVRTAKAANPGRPIECEVESLPDALAAAGAGADWILIDNQEPDTGKAWAEALGKEHPGVKVEASGGITPANLVAYGWADRISLGWLTQRSQAKDFALDWGADPTDPNRIQRIATGGKDDQ